MLENYSRNNTPTCRASIEHRHLFASMFLILTMLITACNRPEYYYLSADKSAFYAKSIQLFNTANGQTVTLHPGGEACHETTRTRVRVDNSIVHIYVGELCGQAITEDDEQLSPLDHSIRSEHLYQSSRMDLFFSNDHFKLPLDDADSLTQHVDATIDNHFYTQLLLLKPEGGAKEIDSIYYMPGMGLMKAFMTSGVSWERRIL